jgi:hypothetical protein
MGHFGNNELLEGKSRCSMESRLYFCQNGNTIFNKACNAVKMAWKVTKMIANLGTILDRGSWEAHVS